MSWNAFRVYGEGHLADTLRCELSCSKQLIFFGQDDRGLAGISYLAFVAHDVTDHSSSDQMDAVAWHFNRASAKNEFVVVVSQVPPGWTRRAANKRKGVFYQVDTIIVSRALERMTRPEQIVVGCADPSEPLPLAYQEYLAAHDCPVLQMSYESAEMAKCAINYMLAEQVRAARDLSTAALVCGADYEDVRRAMHNDARIGQHAYLRPGRTNQHLQRDVDTVIGLLTDGDLPALKSLAPGA